MSELSNFYEQSVAAIVRKRAERELGDRDDASRDIERVVRFCGAAYERTRRNAPDELRIDGLDARAHQRLLAHRAFVVLKPSFEQAVAQVRQQRDKVKEIA